MLWWTDQSGGSSPATVHGSAGEAGSSPAGERQVGYDVQIQDVVSVQEHDLAALRSIESIANPVARRLVISPPATMNVWSTRTRLLVSGWRTKCLRSSRRSLRSRLWRSNLPSATASASEVIELADQTSQEQLTAQPLAVLAWIAAVQGRKDACEARAAEAVELARVTRSVHRWQPRTGRLRCELAGGRRRRYGWRPRRPSITRWSRCDQRRTRRIRGPAWA
jgi:hypothetical protein